MTGNSPPEPDRTAETTSGLTTDAGESIRLDAVEKRYGDLVAVRGIDLAVDPGEFLVLLGPSGCGKTTTLRMIAGLETVTEGTIRIGDDDVTETLPQDRDVSMVFQNYALYPHKTVRENLEFPLHKTDFDEESFDERVRDAAELLEIAPLLDKRPGQLSGGQKQRVALGRTIVREPRVFLLDEPLSNLDAGLRVQTRAELGALQDRLGTTTVYVTHDQEEALSLADRIAIMNDGTVEQVGTPREVYTNPANVFVAGFLGEPSMNFVDVGTGGNDGDLRLFDGAGDDAAGIAAERILDDPLPPETRTLGVRPEDVYLFDDADPIDPSAEAERLTDPFTATVDVVEPLGHEYELTLRRGDTELTATEPTYDGVRGDVDVAFDAERLYLFDESGVAIETGGVGVDGEVAQ